MKQYRHIYGNIRKEYEGVYYLYSYKYTQNNIYQHDSAGETLVACIYHCTKRSKSYLMRRLLCLDGLKIWVEGDTELMILFPKRHLDIVGREMFIYPKPKRAKHTYNFGKNSYEDGVLASANKDYCSGMV